MGKYGITKDVNFQKMCHISHNYIRVDNTSAETQTYFGRNSDGLVNILTGIKSLWFYTGIRMGDYVLGAIMTIRLRRSCI